MAKAQLVNLGLAIEERRVSLDLSRTRLAQRFPVDPKTIERWEKGKNSGGLDELQGITRTEAAELLRGLRSSSGHPPGEPYEAGGG